MASTGLSNNKGSSRCGYFVLALGRVSSIDKQELLLLLRHFVRVCQVSAKASSEASEVESGLCAGRPFAGIRDGVLV